MNGLTFLLYLLFFCQKDTAMQLTLLKKRIYVESG